MHSVPVATLTGSHHQQERKWRTYEDGGNLLMSLPAPTALIQADSADLQTTQMLSDDGWSKRNPPTESKGTCIDNIIIKEQVCLYH